MKYNNLKLDSTIGSQHDKNDKQLYQLLSVYINPKSMNDNSIAWY